MLHVVVEVGNPGAAGAGVSTVTVVVVGGRR